MTAPTAQPPRAARPPSGSPRAWWRLSLGLLATLLCVGIAAGAAAPYLVVGLDELARRDVGLAAHYLEQPELAQSLLVAHAATGGLALLLTPVQWWTSRRRGSLHRRTGWVTGALIVLAGLTGLAVAPVSKAGVVGTLGFGLLALLWMGFTVRGLSAARRRQFTEHRRWMIRVSALTFAAVTLRLQLGVMMAVQIIGGTPPELAFDRAYVLVPFLSWVPNLLIAEMVLRRQRAAVSPLGSPV